MPDRRDDHLVGITLVWVGLLAFIAWGYIFQTPPGGPYTDFMRKAFAVLLAVVVPFFSALILVSRRCRRTGRSSRARGRRSRGVAQRDSEERMEVRLGVRPPGVEVGCRPHG